MDSLEEELPELIMVDFDLDFESLNTPGLEIQDFEIQELDNLDLETQELDTQNLETQVLQDLQGREILIQPEILKESSIPHPKDNSAAMKPRNSFPVLEKVHPKPKGKRANPKPVKLANPETTGDYQKEDQQAVPEKASKWLKQRKAYGSKKKKDPNLPTSHITGYSFFFRETQAIIKTRKPDTKFPAISKTVSGLWQKMSDDEKSVYRQRSDDDRIRYDAQMSEYKKRIDDGDGDDAKMDDGSDGETNDDGDAKPDADSDGETNDEEFAKPVKPAKAKMSKATKPTKAKTPKAKKTPTKAKKPKVTKTPKAKKPSKAQKVKVGLSDDLEKVFGTGSEDLLMLQPTVGEETDFPCSNSGCTKKGVENPGWDGEYCSNECVLLNCKKVFKVFVDKRNRI